MARPEIVELARKAMRGSREAFNQLCEEKSKEMLFTAFGMLSNMEDAEDATQEAMLKMCRYFGKLQTAEAVNVWIYRILNNCCMDILKKRQRRGTEIDIEDEAISIADEDDDFIPEKYVENKELSKKLYDVIMSLPLAKREAIFMYYYDGLSQKEIANIKGVEEKSVSSLITKARKMMKDRLEEGGEMNKMLGAVAPVSVISRVLEQQASEQITAQALAAFNAKAAAATGAVKFSGAAKGTLAAKIVSAVVVVSVISGGALFAVTHYNEAPEIASTTLVTESAAVPSQLLEAVDSIAFQGGDCNCGHQNPDSATIIGDAFVLAETNITWQIDEASSGQTLFTGDGSEVSAEFKELKDADQTGPYTLTYHIEDENQNVVTMTREFEIGKS
ncbi:MAG: RNA polymerase sigma factor [Clostridiales Family XIII bacterium]|jgi:RNA polymerase sigma-70 factor (ECF subfamily)|nr:RNA polymerase sigma factor [Clostridiales Family XIII bacterium]